MKPKLPEGCYVVAVSGGVDSMVQLDILAKQVRGSRFEVLDEKEKNYNLKPSTYKLNLVVAHFNHGIRPDAYEDERLVKKTAKKYRLVFEAGHGQLGAGVSEETARRARHEFLNRIKQKHGALAVITAHHQDDLIETAIINMLRGSGRRGLSAIANNPDIIRPMLSVPKKDILAYAKKHHLDWREDPSNLDESYLRNYVRRQIVPKLTPEQRRSLLVDIKKLTEVNPTINREIANLSQNIAKNGEIDRASFIDLPNEVAREMLIYFLRQHNLLSSDKKTIERLAVVIKTAKAGSKHEVTSGAVIEMTATKALLRQGVVA